MRNSQIIDRSQHQIDEQAVGEENDEQEMLAMKMKAVGINPDLQMLRRPFSMRGSLNMIVRKNEQKNIIAQLLGIDLDGGSEGDGLPAPDDHPDEAEDMALLQKLGLA